MNQYLKSLKQVTSFNLKRLLFGTFLLALAQISFAVDDTADKPIIDSLNKEITMITITTNLGKIELELDAEKAPISVANFTKYIEEGFYNGTIFHRVIPNFMIQGGGFTADMMQKPTNGQIQNEANNGLENVEGSIAMARTPDPHSATAQFFINLKDNDFLNFSSETPQGWGYAVFGKVTSGMDIVKTIAKVQTGNSGGHQDVPMETVLIESITTSE